jgi:glucosamine kinase
MIVLGIDGGGTSCRAAVARADGTIIGRAKVGAANIRTELDAAAANILAAARAAFADAGVDMGAVSEAPAVLGLAGANVGSYGERLKALLPFKEAVIVSDAVIALEGAVGHGDGAIGILGTGAAYLARRADEIRGIGGWGFLVGDQGSGSRMGRDLFEETLLAHDGVTPGTGLTDALLASFHGDPRELVEFTKGATPGDFGRYAPMVFDFEGRGDATGLRIVGRAVEAVEASLSALEAINEGPCCLLGGVAALIEPRLSAGRRARLSPPRQDALCGAVSMAARRFGERGTAHG